MIWKKSEADEPVSAQPQPQFTAPPSPAPRNPVPQPTPKERALIGASIQIKGDLTGGEDLLIEGRVEGKVDLRQQNVDIGKEGRVKADIYGKTISVLGEVQGNLYGEEQVILRRASTVRGNITAPRVTLEDGSNFKGSIDMAPKEAIQASPVRQQVEPKPQPQETQKFDKTVEKSQTLASSGLKSHSGSVT